MTKLDSTLKHLGTVLRRRLADVPAIETPRRIADLLERLSQPAQNTPSSSDPEAVSGTK